MPSTTLGFPYPAASAAPDVPYDLQQLAAALNVKVPVHGKNVARRIHWQTGTVTFDGTGSSTVTHGAGFTPSLVLCIVTSAIGSQVIKSADQYNATTFRAAAFTINGGTAYVGAMNIGWLCLE